MSRFLKVIPVSEAATILTRIAPQPGTEEVPLDRSVGRVLAADVKADTDIPGFDRSVVDGYAVRAADTTGAGEAIPAMLRCTGRIAMGQAAPALRVDAGECIYIPTGGVLPAGADAVAMVENTEPAGDVVLVRKPVARNENVLLHDEDFRQGAVVLRAGRRLSATDTGVLAAAGCAGVPVTRRPVIGIISTGNELVPPSVIPAPGQIRDANAPMIGSYLQECGCIPVYYGIVRDEREAFEPVIMRAVAECDAVLISGGSSKDERDMTAAVIAGRGEVLVHGIAIAPGKPTIIGRISKKPVIGLPGHPASAFVVLVVVVRHLLDRMTGLSEPVTRTVPAVLAQNVPSQRGREDYVRVRLENGRAIPLFGKSGLLNTLAASAGLVRIPAGSEGLESGEQVEVILW